MQDRLAQWCAIALQFRIPWGVISSKSVGVPLASLILLIHTTAFAVTLQEALDFALRNDPIFLATQAQFRVSQERARQAVAGLLPQVAVTGSMNVNQRDYTQNQKGSWQGYVSPKNTTVKEQYNSSTARLQLTQPLWRPNLVNAMTQAELNVSQADFELAAAGQDLLIRLGQAWFETMQARDAIEAAKAQLATARLQWELSQAGLEKGVLSKVEAEDAQSKYMQATAELALAQSSFDIALAALKQIVGGSSFVPPFLMEGAELASLDLPVEVWLKRAEEANPSFLAAQRALAAANEEIRKQHSGHEPSLDLVASYGRTTQEAGITGGQPGFESYEGSVGLQLNVPLYAGGGQSAKVREAEAWRDKVAQELETTRRKILASVTQAWFAGQASRVREAASKKSVEAARLALDGANTARERGIKGEAEVLQSQQQYAGAVRDWRKARYETILNQLKLKAACGDLVRDDLVLLDNAFAASALLP